MRTGDASTDAGTDAAMPVADRHDCREARAVAGGVPIARNNALPRKSPGARVAPYHIGAQSD